MGSRCNPPSRHLLLATNDDDFCRGTATKTGAGFPNYIFAFAVDATDVPSDPANVADFQPKVFNTDALSNIDHIIVVYQENWPFDGLYGSFPGANGLSNASAASTTKVISS